MIALCEAIARCAHAKQSYGGKSYADGHLQGVVERVKVQALGDAGFVNDAMKVAWLHDLLEDTEWEAENLRDVGLPGHVVDAVELLSNGSETYREYVERLCASGNRLALEVKRADLESNVIANGSPDAPFHRLVKDRWLPALGRVLQALGHA